MEAGTDHERSKDHVHEDGAPGLSGQHCALCKLPEAFGLSATKSWYPHYFNTAESLHYVGPIPDISYYGVNEMGEEERKDFFGWHERQRSETFENKRVLES